MFTFFIGTQRYVVDAATFDVGIDYLYRGGLVGYTSDASGIFSAWVRFDGGDGVHQTLISSTASGTGDYVFIVSKVSTNKIQIALNAGQLIINSSASYIAGASWHHLLFSWDGGTNAKLYVDDADQTVTVAKTPVSASAMDSFYVSSPYTGLNGALSEAYLSFGSYIDLAVESNRRKFISAILKPVNLGASGEFPTGAAPIVYLHLSDAEAAANFATNRGTGGNMTITGALSTASSSPSD